MEEVIFPVCAPALLRRRPPLSRPEDLAWYPLLHDVTAWRGGHTYAEWEHYLQALGVTALNPRRGYTFNRHRLAMEAAMAGMGVAIARQALLADELTTGALIAPFPQRIDTGKRYGIVYPSGASMTAGWPPCMTGSWRRRSAMPARRLTPDERAFSIVTPVVLP